MDIGPWWAAVHRVAESDTAEVTLYACMHWRQKWQPTPVFLPGEAQGQQTLVCCRLWGRTELDTTEATTAAAAAAGTSPLQYVNKPTSSKSYMFTSV